MLTERGNSIVCEIINKCVLLSMQIFKYFEKLSNQNLRVMRISNRVIPSADHDRSETTWDCIAHVFLCSFGPSILFSFYFVMINIALYNKFKWEHCYSLVAAYLCATYAAPNSNNRFIKFGMRRFYEHVYRFGWNNFVCWSKVWTYVTVDLSDCWLLIRNIIYLLYGVCSLNIVLHVRWFGQRGCRHLWMTVKSITLSERQSLTS
jgi:hypothetical protein